MPDDKPKNPREWNGLVPGDVVEYKGGGSRFVYRGMYDGFVGCWGTGPEPVFGRDHPVDPDEIYFLRRLTTSFPTKIPGDSLLPEQYFGECAPPIINAGGRQHIRFLNGGPGDFRKVGHVTPQDWERMKEEALAGQTEGP